MEPCRSQGPEPGFLEFVRDGAHRAGAFSVFDEITIGGRLRFGGAHLGFGVAPDLAVFAKATGNGHPMAAVVGTREAMSSAHDSFNSSTYWTESVGPVAALATIRKMRETDLPAQVARVGIRVKKLWEKSGSRHGLPLHSSGYPCLAHFGFDHQEAEALLTLFTQKMLDRDFLAGTGFTPILAHTDPIVEAMARTSMRSSPRSLRS
ncbi:MAG: aminotransferase class III-fold pyridoxal phosphate-dependent enzyme [Spirochaetota bacterium]